MEYKIISTGSKGNCIIINDVMVDCGVPFNRIKNELYSVKYLIITHVHSDHMKIRTLQQIMSKYPRIKLIGNYEVHAAWNCNIIANEGFPVEVGQYSFYPFKCEHDVLCYGYTWTFEDQEIIYATDTGTLDHAPKKKYDWFFIESNHDEAKLEAIRGEKLGGYDPYLSGKRHLSTQQAKTFYYMNRRNEASQFIELHQSSRFY